MAAFERLAHHVGIAGAVEAVVGAAVGEVEDRLHHLVVADFLRIDEVGHAESLGHRALGRVDVDADDAVGADQFGALDDVESDAAEPEHDDVRAGLDAGGPDHRADAGGDAAADVADLVERSVLSDLRHGDLGHHREVGEGRAAHIMVDRLVPEAEARRSVGHQALALGGANRRAEVGLLRQARFTLAAFGGVERDDVVADLHRGDSGPDLADDPGAFMAEDRRKDSLRILALQRVGVGVADPGRHDLDQHLARLRAIEVDLVDLQGLVRSDGDRGAGLHGKAPSFRAADTGEGDARKIRSRRT
jgi:hypothetical protein